LSGAKLYVNGPIDFMKDCKVDGIHLNSQRLKQEYLKISKKQSMIKLSASCHNLNEIKMAEKLNCEFAVLSPVRPTKSHPGKKPLGWKKFQQMVEQCNIPVYALGGVSESDLEKSWNCGGQGIAAISGLWLGH